MITVEIDQITPCLRDAKTGTVVETEVLRVRSKDFIKKFNKKTGGIQTGKTYYRKMKYMHW